MPPKEATAARRRTFLTNVQKRQLQQFWSEHPDLQLLAVADWVRERFGVSVGRATLYRIYHAPPEAFAGNGHQKKHRRVKFPALERDIVALCEQSRRVNDCDSALSDDALLRAAAELRARHGISEAELKLSNGWLHRFKERHALRAAPQALGGECRAALAAEETGSDVAVIATESRKFTMGRKRKPRAPPRRKKTQSEDAVATDRDVDSGDDCNLGRVDEATATSICGTASCANEPLASDASTSSAFEDTADFTSPSAPAAAQPLTYLSASAADSVTAVGFVRWKLKSGMAHAEHFSVDDDGVSILRSAKYQLNVELQHTSPPIGSLPAIFKVWAGVELLGQCEHPIQSQRGRALSVLQLECMLSSQAVIRVEYHAAGVVYKDSRLVLRLLR